MIIKSVQNSNNPSFNGGPNRAALFGLEKISEHGASFAAGVSLLSAGILRPISISLTPNTDKENKKYASVNSISSALVKFLMAETVAVPIENAVKKIDKEPLEYLKKSTVKNLKETGKELAESKDYKFATQILKLGANFISAIPKSMLTIALLPVIMNKIFPPEKPALKTSLKQDYDPVFSPVYSNSPSFGNLSNCIGKIIDNKSYQRLAKKFSKNSDDIARNMSNATDILLTAVSAARIKKSKKIEKERKKPLIYNSVISTGISVMAGSAIDSFVKTSTKGTVDKFKKAHINDPKLSKYIEGINILRPTIIFALLYYGILPAATTFLADKIDKSQKKN